MKFRMLKIIFGVSLLSFVMAFGVCAPSAFAMEVTGEAADVVPGDSTGGVTGNAVDVVPGDSTGGVTGKAADEVIADVTDLRKDYNSFKVHGVDAYGNSTTTTYGFTYTKATVNGKEYASEYGTDGLIVEAARYGDLEAVKAFAAKFGIDAKGWRDATALNIACANGDMPIVCWLVEHGADINNYSYWLITNPDWHLLGTPMLSAVYTENLELMQYLLDHGADVNSCVYYYLTPDYTPLQHAIRYNKPQAAAFLRAHGAVEPSFPCGVGCDHCCCVSCPKCIITSGCCIM